MLDEKTVDKAAVPERRLSESVEFETFMSQSQNASRPTRRTHLLSSRMAVMYCVGVELCLMGTYIPIFADNKPPESAFFEGDSKNKTIASETITPDNKSLQEESISDSVRCCT